jgi:ABC-type branched-subunit amino acid transport system substrate-binding protein
MTKPPKRPRDINQLAATIVAIATGEYVDVATPIAEGKNAAAVELGRLGGLKGGKARAEKLSPEDRKAIAQKAAQARYGKKSD